jgi:hypothetical protein
VYVKPFHGPQSVYILTLIQLLPAESEVRRKHEALLLDKLYDMGVLSVCT